MHVVKKVPFHSVPQDTWHIYEEIQPIAQWPSLTIHFQKRYKDIAMCKQFNCIIDLACVVILNTDL